MSPEGIEALLRVFPGPVLYVKRIADIPPGPSPLYLDLFAQLEEARKRALDITGCGDLPRPPYKPPYRPFDGH